MSLRSITVLPRTVWLLGFISLLNDTASELVYPLIPVYLTVVLAADTRALGLIEGVVLALSSFMQLLSGYMSDRRRSAKPWVVCGYAVAAVARPLYALASAWPAVLALRFADRLGKGLRSAPRDAMLAAAAPKGQRGLAFGLHRAMDNLGAVIGPLLAYQLLRHGVELREVFLWTALPGVLTVLLALTVREPEHLTPIITPAPLRLCWAPLTPHFRRYLIAVGLFTLGYPSNMFLLLRARELGVADYQLPLMWAMAALVGSVFSTSLSGLSDRLGRKLLITIGWLAYAVVLWIMGWLDLPTWSMWPLFAALGLFFAATEGTEKALVADLAGTDQRGTAFGFFHLLSGLMLLPASAVFGWLWHNVGTQVAFGFSASCALAAVLLLRLWVFK